MKPIFYSFKNHSLAVQCDLIGFALENMKFHKWQFSFEHFFKWIIITYFSQVDFAAGFLDDSFNAGHQHFTRITPAVGEILFQVRLYTQLGTKRNLPYSRCEKVNHNRCLAFANFFIKILFTLHGINLLQKRCRGNVLSTDSRRCRRWKESPWNQR